MSQGVHGESQDQAGVVGMSQNFVGVYGESQCPDQPGVFGKGKKLAGGFVGNVYITGELTVYGVPFSALIQRISSLEKQVAILTESVSALSQRRRVSEI